MWLIERLQCQGKGLTTTREMSPPHGFSLGCEWSKMVGYNPLFAICDPRWIPANPPPAMAFSIMISSLSFLTWNSSALIKSKETYSQYE
jgi:hypothetical protein